MNKNYYYFATALPPLNFDEVPKITSQQFLMEVKENLSIGDLKKIDVLCRYYDLINLRSSWNEKLSDPQGKFAFAKPSEMSDRSALLQESLCEFMDDQTSIDSQLKDFSNLLCLYFKQEIAKNTGFLRNYLKFERELRIVWTGIRAKKLSRKLEVELQFEDPNDPIVVQMMAQKDAKTFVFPNGYEDLAELIENNNEQPVMMQKQLSQYRYNKIEQLQDLGQFSFEKILGYFAQLIIVEKWFQLDEKIGQNIADKILSVAG